LIPLLRRRVLGERVRFATQPGVVLDDHRSLV